jgi:hypothetical protein
MAADHVAGPLVPDDEVDETKILDASLQFFIFRIAGLKVNPRIVGCRVDLADRDCSDIQ